MPTQYEYITKTSKNGIKLHIMKTNASNIMLRNLKCEHNLFDRIYFGINGGFFSWTKNGNRYRVLNLAKCDGAVVGPNSDDGISNGWLGGGVIYWDGKYLKCLTGEPTIEASEIPGTKDTGTWAQGGYSMWLGDKKAKERSLEEVNNDDQYGYLSNSAKGRTALVADLTYKKVYLIVTPSSNTFTTFKQAIEEYLNITEGDTASSRYKGIMLDGSGSSQMKAKNSSGDVVEIRGDERNLCEIIALRNAT